MLSEEQVLMRDSCRAFVDDVVIPFIRKDWQREWTMVPEERLPPEILAGADEIGIRTLGVPEEFGGVELDATAEVQTFAIISEEMPRGASDRWLPYNAPEAAMQTRAVRKDGGWVINGRKQFISNGYDAGLYVVYANSNPKVGLLQGTSSFLVPRETPGLTVARCNETMGCRFMNNGELVFEDMHVPD